MIHVDGEHPAITGVWADGGNLPSEAQCHSVIGSVFGDCDGEFVAERYE